METLQFLFQGFTVALEPINLMWVTIGGVLGTIVGMLPGLGPATGVAVLLPLTFTMGAESAMITMAGVYYGAMFGGSRSSILINTPGDGAAVAATFDGYPMAKNGKAEAALAISAIASFIGGGLSIIFMIVSAKAVAQFALKFGPAEYFMLMVFALAATASMSRGNMIKGFISMIIGLMIATIGLDAQSGVQRFTFGIMELQGGIDFLVVIIAIYALGEVFKSFKIVNKGTAKMQTKFGKIWISKEEWDRTKWPILRSAPLGFFVGALPGAGGTVASLMAYNNEKQMSKNPENFGKGEIIGLAAPESANNAASVGAFIPMLSLGVPGSGTTAVMMGALLMLGIQPGPMLFVQHPDVAWGLIASMFIGNIILAIVNIPLAGLLVRVLAIPGKVLYPLVLGLAFVGTYAIGNSIIDFYSLLIFAFMGYIMNKEDIPTSPLVLAIIVGNMMEQSFRQAMVISNNSFGIFFKSGVSIVLFILTIGSVALSLYKTHQDNKKAAAQNQ